MTTDDRRERWTARRKAAVVDELDRVGLADNTILLLRGDHGWRLGEHDRWCKHSHVENDGHVPRIVSVPRMDAAGQHTEALVGPRRSLEGGRR